MNMMPKRRSNNPYVDLSTMAHTLGSTEGSIIASIYFPRNQPPLKAITPMQVRPSYAPTCRLAISIRHPTAHFPVEVMRAIITESSNYRA